MGISGVTDYNSSYGAGSTKQSSRLGRDEQTYLNGLKEKYPDVNITVADFNSEKQLDAYILGSRGYNNIAVSSNIISKMASDPAAAAKYEKVFEEMAGNTERVEKYVRENNQEILGAGAVIDRNGKVTYWMAGRSKETMENPGTVYKEKIQKQIKEKREKEREEEALKEKRLKKAETMEKLLEKPGSRVVREEPEVYGKEQKDATGSRVDFTI